ncbi:MAG: carboxypeptidase-like regulatory domain-containing protein [Ignavibacteriales bacterium]|nr:carboxypeptidase-like regulatory domain-containing protein [Ignavibacteriales bacterium]
MRKFLLLTILTLFFTSQLAAGTTGKISGTVTDSKTKEPLVGVNVVLQGTTLGASTDVEGYFVILNVTPGTYTVKASYVGYSARTITNVRVNIDQTTSLDITLNEEAILASEVVVVAQQPIVQRDVASSRVNLNVEEIENLPVVSVQSVIGLQAGILSGASGPIIRGGGADQTAFVVNGMTLRDERDNTPYMGISFTSVKEIQVQTGGFNAEFGNIRSGLINVVTKEGDKQKYSVSFLGRYKGAARKHFGEAVNSPNSYWIRSYIDDAVAWTGTDNGAWDDYTKRQYQPFRGWNKVSQQLLADNDPSNDLTPEAAQRLFLWQHRRQLDITKPDYDADFSFSGPVPFISEELGDLAFIASYRTTREMYVIPLSEDSYKDYNFQFKLTSDLKSGMKLSLEGISGKQWGTTSSRSGLAGIFRSAGGIAGELDNRSGASYLDARVFATDYWAPTQKFISGYGLKFTHVLSSSTYYDITINQFGTRYDTNPGTPRNTAKVNEFGQLFFDEAPFGNYSGTSSGIGSSMNMGLGFSNSRDSSRVSTWSARFDIASQLDKYNNIKAGLEFVYTDNAVNYALIEPALPSNNSHSSWQTFPIRGAFYIQEKLEFEGMIANIGVRVDYSNANGDWYVLNNPYDKALSGAQSAGIDTLVQKEATKAIINVSPRLGIAFPISVDSKLYFNYGHFRSMPIPENLYLLRRSTVTQAVTRLANPNNPLSKTVSYELGYEHNLFDEYLLRVAGTYKDVSEQPRLVTYTSRDNSVSYSIPEPESYADIRTFEATITKNRGEWIRGFINYTYEVSTSGNFGLSSNSENPAIQRENQRNKTFFEQSKPIPRPYARANVDLFTPLDWGPEIFGIKPLEDLRMNILASWRAGVNFSWTGPGGVKPGFDNNIQWTDNFNVDLRISKSFDFGPFNIEFFADIYNALNIKTLDYKAGFVDLNDYDDYMKSLHMPEEFRQFGNSYKFIAGTDKPGDIRTGPYIPWDENASESQKEEWNKNKSYIDMPNLEYSAFLNPRAIFWGIKINYDLN